jgi:hypothetical protein
MTATTSGSSPTPRPHVAQRPIDLKDPTYQAFWLLRMRFTGAPIVFVSSSAENRNAVQVRCHIGAPPIRLAPDGPTAGAL